MRISKIKYQLQGLGETISDSELITYVINALPPSWDGFAGGIYARKYTPTFEELWALCVLEETRLKAKDDTEPNNENFHLYYSTLLILIIKNPCVVYNTC